MGEFDQCHICIGFSGYLGFIFWWINLHLFAIYAYFLRLCSVLVCWMFIADFYDSSHVLGRNVWDESKLMKCGPWGSKEACKEAQNTPRKGKPRGPRRSTEGHQNAAEQQNRATTTSGSWWPPRPVVSPTAVVGRFPPVVRFPLRVPLRLPTVLLRFLPLYCNVSGHSDKPNSLHSHLFSIFIVLD